MNIVAVTRIPAPFQVEFFDSISRRADFRAVYVYATDVTRRWKGSKPAHQSLILELEHDSEAEFFRWIDTADFVVFSDYQSPVVRRAMARREAVARPWCFWGERLGYRSVGCFGVAYRYFRLGALRRSRAPIWGMGTWAIETYRREFGRGRQYLNVPYYSDLNRFRASGERRGSTDIVRFLYSGALIHRKGVDLLSRAFRKLSAQLPQVTLAVTGSYGPLRSMMEGLLKSVADRVTFLPPVPWEGLPLYYAQADVLCAPSRYDGWGMIVPEGLASGLPVIATEHMGAAIDLITPGINGWRIPPGNEDALYAAMFEAATMGPDKRRQMSYRAQTEIEKHSLVAGTDRFLDATHVSLTAWQKSMFTS